jgi:hypothetical protein
VFPRTTNQHGCVTLHSHHFYVEAGLPQTQVLLWVAGTQLRAAFDHVILAEYHSLNGLALPAYSSAAPHGYCTLSVRLQTGLASFHFYKREKKSLS